MQEFGSGNKHDELSWNDIAMYASRKMSEINTATTYVTTDNLKNNPSLIDDMRRNGYNPVVVPDNLINKMEDYNTGAEEGKTLVTANQYIKEEQNRFTPQIVEIDSLSVAERRVWAELMKDIGKVKLTMQPQKKSLQKVWEWLEKYVAPSLKLFAEVGKIEQRDYIANLIANGEMNITQKQLYDDYIKARKLDERG